MGLRSVSASKDVIGTRPCMLQVKHDGPLRQYVLQRGSGFLLDHGPPSASRGPTQFYRLPVYVLHIKYLLRYERNVH